MYGSDLHSKNGVCGSEVVSISVFASSQRIQWCLLHGNMLLYTEVMIANIRAKSTWIDYSKIQIELIHSNTACYPALNTLTSAILISVSETAFDVPLQREGGRGWVSEWVSERASEWETSVNWVSSLICCKAVLYLSCCSCAKRCCALLLFIEMILNTATAAYGK